MPLLIGLAALLTAGGFFVDKAGEGVDDASNGAVKLAAAGVVGYIALKKFKVI